MGDMSRTISVEIPDDLYPLLASLAASKEMSVNSLVSDAVLATLGVSTPRRTEEYDQQPTLEEVWDYISRTHAKVLHRLAQ